MEFARVSPLEICHHIPVGSLSSAVETVNHIPERAWFSQKPLTPRINPETQLLKVTLLRSTAGKFYPAREIFHFKIPGTRF